MTRLDQLLERQEKPEGLDVLWSQIYNKLLESDYKGRSPDPIYFTWAKFSIRLTLSYDIRKAIRFYHPNYGEYLPIEYSTLKQICEYLLEKE